MASSPHVRSASSGTRAAAQRSDSAASARPHAAPCVAMTREKLDASSQPPAAAPAPRASASAGDAHTASPRTSGLSSSSEASTADASEPAAAADAGA